MATLVDPHGTRHPLAGPTVIGRTPGLPIVIPAAYVSGVHAELRWTGDAWEVQHLSGSNPTYLNGAPLPRLAWSTLREGDSLSFGVPDEPWTLVDAVPRAFAACGERRVSVVDGVLAFPDEVDPEVVIGEDSGRYRLQDHRDLDGPSCADVVDRQTFTTASGEVWTVHLPATLPRTMRVQIASPAGARVRFIMDETEQAVSIELENDKRRFPPRVHFRLLLQLARARRDDAAAGEKDPSEQGWRHLGVLSKELRIPVSQLNVQIHRARRAFDGAVGHHYDVVDRSGPSGFVRLGFVEVTIEKAGEVEGPKGTIGPQAR